MVKSCVFFAVRTEFLNIMKTSFLFKGLKCNNQVFVASCCDVYEIKLKISSVTHNVLEYVYSRQHVSVPLGPSTSLTSIKSRAGVVFVVITQHLLLIYPCLMKQNTLKC
jgi:hypothetical protein